MSTSAYRRRYHKDAGAGSYAGIPGCNKIHAGHRVKLEQEIISLKLMERVFGNRSKFYENH